MKHSKHNKLPGPKLVQQGKEKDTTGMESNRILGKDSPMIIFSRSHRAPSMNRPCQKRHTNTQRMCNQCSTSINSAPLSKQTLWEQTHKLLCYQCFTSVNSAPSINRLYTSWHKHTACVLSVFHLCQLWPLNKQTLRETHTSIQHTCYRCFTSVNSAPSVNGPHKSRHTNIQLVCYQSFTSVNSVPVTAYWHCHYWHLYCLQLQSWG